MARQVAALTKTSPYRHNPIPAKDLAFLGNSLQTSQLSLNGPLGANDFSAFKTPPEGHTPVDVKQFDYEDETLTAVETKSVPNQLVGLSDSHHHLNDSGVLPAESSLGVDSEHNFKTIDVDVAKLDDDAFHTPPEFQGIVCFTVLLISPHCLRHTMACAPTSLKLSRCTFCISACLV